MAGLDELFNEIPTQEIASKLGADQGAVDSAVKTLVPVLVGGIQQNVQAGDINSSALESAAVRQGASGLLDGGVRVDRVDTNEGDQFVTRIFGGNNSNAVSAALAGTGAGGRDLIKNLLPILAPIVLAYLGTQMSNLKITSSPAETGLAGPGGGGLGEVLGHILSGGGAGGRNNPLGSILGSVLGGSQGGAFGHIPAPEVEGSYAGAPRMDGRDDPPRRRRPPPTGGGSGHHSSSREPLGARWSERTGNDDEEVRGGDVGDAGPVSVTPPRDPGPPPGEGPELTSPRPRHLQAQMPERVATGRPLSLRVAITLSAGDGVSAGLKNFLVPPEGAIVTVIVSAPGLVPDGDMQQDIVVPADADSEPHRFAFTAEYAGLRTVTVEAFRGGTYLGAVQLEVSVEQSTVKPSEGRVRTAELPSFFAELGEVTLQVRRDPTNGYYRFQLLGDPMHGEVDGGVMGEANAAVEALVAELHKMAANKSRYANSGLVRQRLKNLGIDLWLTALPQQVREQFWEQADRIKMFTIVTDHDLIPWELLYPADGSNDNGFLAEQFPVVRRSYAAKRYTSLPIGTAAYVVPPDSPTDARDEVEAIRALLGNQIGDRGVLSDLSAVSDIMLDPAVPGIMHFACHNTFSAESGSSIALGGGPFTPIDLANAVAKTSLASGRPLVFLNACRSAAEIPWFASMSGWATRFVQAGAGAFIGSLWAVRSSAARTFAEAFYEQFVTQGQPLGTSSLLARKAVSEDGGDPTWLAYSVYGNPAAVVAEPADR